MNLADAQIAQVMIPTENFDSGVAVSLKFPSAAHAPHRSAGLRPTLPQP